MTWCCHFDDAVVLGSAVLPLSGSPSLLPGKL